KRGTAKSKRPAKEEKPAKRQPRAQKRKEEETEPVERTEEELVDLTSRVYKLVVERGRDGVLQSEIWKELGLTSRDGSRLAIRLERRGLIGRVKVLEDGRWTYKLTPLRFPTDMTSIEKAPCIVCQYEPKCSVEGEISPYVCPWIGPWVIQEALAARNPPPEQAVASAR
ncbi:MAG TPA: MarR family winged helix-turn-helix transcriptional regulator, partial [Nitrososphaerales archaeon]|nr:MarR family winged helix-turn-helix transcriptional regulator [Nitrososphaerales archaeon]